MVVVSVPGEVVVVETGSPMSNAPVWESVVVTSPIGEAWKVYPELYGVSVKLQ